jgi:penicillin amidase
VRFELAQSAASAPSLDVSGLTLAGVPVVVVGSNGSIAWGFTNTYGDWADLVQLDVDAQAPGRYLTPDGPTEFAHLTERIRVRGGSDDTLEVRETIWGPVFDTDLRGRERVAAWIAHDAAATNLASLELETARDVPAALDIAARSGIPPQNFVVADAQGNIGWTIMGRIPVRVGYDPRAPASWSTRGVGWQGWLAPAAYPRIMNPARGRIWTANQRVVQGSDLEAIGDGGYALGARAGQIRDALLALEGAQERDMLTIQLDDRARVHERWRALLLERLDDAALDGNDTRAEARRLVEGWHGHAAINSAGYRILREWRERVRDAVFAALTREVRAHAPDMELRVPSQFEGPLWQLVRAEPLHLLDPAFDSLRSFELAKLDEVLAELGNECKTLAACTWGERNRARIRHPLSRALPVLSALLDMPDVELPGDLLSPRAQSPTFGASERFAVSPGHEGNGYFELAGGQSGHPLSPYFRAGFDAWAEGQPLPFLPGPVVHRLTLRQEARR